MHDRVILHADMNSCYASIECLHRPELRNLPVAVAGDPGERRGIILAKNDLAKRHGVKTAEAVWQARQKCPGLVLVPPNYPLYLRFSRLFKGILLEYSDQVESFGIDEAWIDVTGSVGLFGTGQEIADEIRHRVREELGITASVGVSWNKIFAKLGSDYKKPDATTEIDRDNYKAIVWPLAADDLCFLGQKTFQKLERQGIRTIGQLANADVRMLRELLGVQGETLWKYANGRDTSPVALYDERDEVKSIGNSTTSPRDLITETDVRLVVQILSESVAARLREHRLKGRVVAVTVRDNKLLHFSRQTTLPESTNLHSVISEAAMKLIIKNWDWHTGIRSLGVRVTDLWPEERPVQASLFENDRQQKSEALERTIDHLRSRFGHGSIQTALVLSDPALSGINPKEEHIIHPVAFHGR